MELAGFQIWTISENYEKSVLKKLDFSRCFGVVL